MKKTICIRVDEETLKLIDQVREKFPYLNLSALVRIAIYEYFKNYLM